MKKTIYRVVIDPKDKHQWTDKIVVSFKRMNSPDDFYRIIARAIAESQKIEINRGLVQGGTAKQIAVAVAQRLADGVDTTVITKALIEYVVAQYHAADLVSNIKHALDEYAQTPDGREIMAYRNRHKAGIDADRQR